MEVIQSVGVVAFKGDKVLLVRHGEKATHLTGSVGIPSGKLNEVESHLKTAVREFQEESGLQASEESFVQLPKVYRATIESKKGPLTFDWVVFLCKEWQGDLKGLKETTPFWENVDRIRDLNTLPNVLNAIEEAMKLLD